MRRRLISILLTTIIAAVGISSLARADGLNIDHTYGDKIGGWTIGYSDTLDGCLAAATYRDQTTIWLGLGGSQLGAYLAFTNPSWRWIEVGKEYQLTLSTVPYGNWEGKSFAIERDGEKGLLLGPINSKFQYDVARADNIIVSVQQTQIANLNLNDSTAALLAATECERQRSLAAKQPQPRPEEKVATSGTGFFISSRENAGYILTNHHVIKGCSTVQVSSADQSPHQGQVIAADEQNDLALILSDRIPRALPAFRIGARIGETVEVYGFPLAETLAPGIFRDSPDDSRADMNICAFPTFPQDRRELRTAAGTWGGRSGGRRIDLVILPGIWTYSSRRLLWNG